MFDIIKPIHDSAEVKANCPLPQSLAKIRDERDRELKDIFLGKDNRFIAIIGPCSADNEDAVCDYTVRLAKLNEKIKEKIFVIPRVYSNKPRTRGEGYKGMYHQPDPHKGTDIQLGIYSLRHMHIKVIAESGLTCADEMLYPTNLKYVDDLLGYISVGARSTENQEHRLVASGIDCPVGIKNPMNGSISVLMNSIYAAQTSHEFLYHGNQVRSSGNPFAHAILRGAVDSFGNNIQNYHFEDVIGCIELYLKESFKNPAIIIDCNHSNSSKKFDAQPRIAHEILSNMQHTEFKRLVKGIMVESYIEDGAQSFDGAVYGKSITDACLGWDKTERLLLSIAERL